MDTAHRRIESISILSAKGHMTMRELAWELDVSRRMIMNDDIALSFDYPIYTKPDEGGGVSITENFPTVCRCFQGILNNFSLTQRKGSHRLMGKVWAVFFVRLRRHLWQRGITG